VPREAAVNGREQPLDFGGRGSVIRTASLEEPYGYSADAGPASNVEIGLDPDIRRWRRNDGDRHHWSFDDQRVDPKATLDRRSPNER
jgi:hypothetical protein